ncbi:GNAT family N-acetyltransferase [Phenylobacterium soli]|uniref:GNAT family N-acetyltransferase n=1 Tax=Phenylobacterium soli TaxID=2170551 RepID=A0A328AAS6_9CAUL|nr:GNAT family N-acetyltransferase [Phenylobacterium soli]RAK51685.1 GNAT family N-acetyltransferase [Phenylobacterium soli]
MVQTVRIQGPLPEGFEALRQEAEAEGHKHLTRLAREWATEPQAFHVLLGVFHEGGLVAIGGVTDEPEDAGEPAWRMRRLYVARRARGMGVARAIANGLGQEALDSVRLVTVHAGSNEAARFWEAMGFSPVAGRPWSHEFRG